MVKKICVVTGWGKDLGMGHIQRMAALVKHLNGSGWAEAKLCANPMPFFFPDDVLAHSVSAVPEGTDLIVRDMRDSTVGDIEKLLQKAPLLAVDDLGEGRERATYAIDLLPNLTLATTAPVRSEGKLFIHGYTFLESLYALADTQIEKSIDVSIYPGFNPDPKSVERVLGLMPEGSTCAVLQGEASYLRKGGRRYPVPADSYAGMLLMTRCLVSHFGITLYEASLCGCRLIALNPSEYHSRLADSVAEALGVINAGEYSRLDEKKFAAAVADALAGCAADTISAGQVYRRATEDLNRFIEYIRSIVQG